MDQASACEPAIEREDRQRAELVVLSAELACLRNRRAAAESSGARETARDIAQRIGGAMAARRHLLRDFSTVA
jgi:hypothetical protein